MTAKSYDFFSGTQEDINRRFLRKILALEAKVGSEDTDINQLETDVGNLKTTVGDNNSGLVKSVNTLTTTVGDADGGLVKDVDSIETGIGHDDEPWTIKGRLWTLEHTTSSQQEPNNG